VAESPDLVKLKALFDGAMAGLDGVVAKRMFGCDGYFVAGNIFGLVWKDGRLGLRLDDAEAWAQLRAFDGASGWWAGDREMRHWVLLPEAWHRQPPKLKAWAQRAYELAAARPEKASVTRRSGVTKKVRPAVFKRLDAGSGDA
jgi:TfoX/Sxy family transcriptional regulator of competence genes